MKLYIIFHWISSIIRYFGCGFNLKVLPVHLKSMFERKPNICLRNVHLFLNLINVYNL